MIIVKVKVMFIIIVLMIERQHKPAWSRGRSGTPL